MLAESWAGVMPVTTGSSGLQSDWATKILALVPGTVIGGISGAAVTVSTSLVSNRLTIRVPAAKIVGRLVRVWGEVAVLKTTKTSWVPSRRA